MHRHCLGDIYPGRSAVSIKEFLGAFPIGPTLFHRLQKEGQILTIKIGSRTLIPLTALEAWLDSTVAGRPGAEGGVK